jgi:hypothetical protein
VGGTQKSFRGALNNEKNLSERSAVYEIPLGCVSITGTNHSLRVIDTHPRYTYVIREHPRNSAGTITSTAGV